MMDEIEQFPLTRLPMHSLSLRLARAPIKMRHGQAWKIDKVNPVHDLVVCMTGKAHYEMDSVHITMSPGQAMLIPAYTRFRGQHGGGEDDYQGIAQHFSLELFNRGDIINQMALQNPVNLRDWAILQPLVSHYRNSTSLTATTLQQHHQFMVILLAFLEDAFVDWRSEPDTPTLKDQLSLHIMRVASHLSADPLGADAEEAIRAVPYNPDYFRRAFRDRIGMTPQKYRELKRMEFAIHRLHMGLTVKQVALELGYNDQYFFSRQFKRHIGASPSRYRGKISHDGD